MKNAVSSTRPTEKNLEAPCLSWVHFVPEVLQARLEFQASLQSLPRQAQEAFGKFSTTRIHSGGGRPMLGEALPWFFAELLSVSRDSSFRQVVRGWLGIYYAVMLTDDVLDTPSADSPMKLLTSQLLLIRGMGDLFVNARHPDDLRKIIDEAFARCATAAFLECESRRKERIGGVESSLRMVQQKFAIAEICLKSLMRLCSNESPKVISSKHCRKFINRMMLGLQLLDDLTDWPEDLRNAHYTRPLAHAARTSPYWHTVTRKEPEPKVAINSHSFLLLIQTGALSETLSEARNALREALLCLSKEANSSKTLFHDIFSNATNLIDQAYSASEKARVKLVLHYPIDYPISDGPERAVRVAGIEEDVLFLKTRLDVITAHS